MQYTILMYTCILATTQPELTRSKSECPLCLKYAFQIEDARQRGDGHLFQLLRSEIDRANIPSEQKVHLLKYVNGTEATMFAELGIATPDGPEIQLAQAGIVTQNAEVRRKSNELKARTQQSAKPSVETKVPDPFPNAVVRRSGLGERPQIDSEVAGHGVLRGAKFDIDSAYRDAGYTLDADETSIDEDAEPVVNDSNLSQAELAEVALPDGALQIFSPNYLRLRKRYFDFFYFEGQTATTLELKENGDPTEFGAADVKTAEFADQTLHMGQALVTFAGESHLLKQKNLDSSGSDAVVKRILAAFQELDDADEMPEFYGISKKGFFLRDLVYDTARRGVPTDWKIVSDSKTMIDGGPKHQAAMSLDQAVSLFVGWWAVSRYASDSTCQSLARDQCDRVMNFLRDSLFLVKLPNGDSIPTNRGPEFRYAAGFLCRMAEATTGNSYFGSSSIDVTIKGDPIRFRDDNLGEFEIPGFTIPATMKVGLSHPIMVSMKPAAVAVMTHPRIKVRFSDLFPGRDPNVTLPCAHMVQAHPEGHTNMIPCVHLTISHPEGDLIGTLPCAHMVPEHPAGDKVTCVHPTAKHPGGHSVTLPCLHIGKLHGSHSKTVAGVRVTVPCTHLGPKHPGGHSQNVPCAHMTVKHPNGDIIPCVHLSAEHPEGHKQFTPCIHPTAVHPAGDPVNLPCAHFDQAHPSGHGFDLTSLDIDIPLGDKVHSYTRHIVLQCFAFESDLDAVSEFLPIAMSSDHIWSALLRALAMGDVPSTLISTPTREALQAMPDDRGPDNRNTKPWTRSNRWERCTDLEPSGGSPLVYNGLDYMSLEVLAKLNGIE